MMCNELLATKSKAEEFANEVLRDELLRKEYWMMEWTTCAAGICERGKRIIYVPERLINCSVMWEMKEYILHEISHIFNPSGKHNTLFYKIYIRLLTKYMGARKIKKGEKNEM